MIFSININRARVVVQLLTTIIFLGVNNGFGQDVWTQRSDLISGSRFFSTGFSIGNKGYFGTGIDSLGNTMRDFWEWDQATDAWTQKADFGGTPRKGAVSFAIAGKGYLGTGYDGVTPPHGYLKDFWQYDPILNQWFQKSDFAGSARELAVGFSINSMGYIGCGYDGSSLPYGVTNDFWQWNEGLNVWTQVASFAGNARQLAVGFSIAKKGYIGTGMDTLDSFMKDFWEWDQITNTWTQKASFGGSGRYSASGFSIGTKGYIGIGRESNKSVSGYKNDFWEWSQIANVWSKKSNFPSVARADAFAFAIGTSGYIGGGQYKYLNQASYKDFWEYNPTGNGINEVDLTGLVSIYPNPSSGRFQLQNLNLTIESISVFNSGGEEMGHAIEYKNSTIDLSGYNNGVYLFLIKCKEGVLTKKIVIIR